MLTTTNQFASEQLEWKVFLLSAFLEMCGKSTRLVIFYYQALPFVCGREAEFFFSFLGKRSPQCIGIY